MKVCTTGPGWPQAADSYIECELKGVGPPRVGRVNLVDLPWGRQCQSSMQEEKWPLPQSPTTQSLPIFSANLNLF